jgi:3-oxoacyl-[acyl-carrier protein] reductase
MDLALGGKVVLVTGAGQGLGRALGLAFAREGAHVALHYHASASGAEAGAAGARALGVKAIAVGADLRSDAAVAAAVGRVERELGPIDVLINNAAATKRQPFLESTPTATARASTVGLTRSLARELARHGIRANCVSIALVQTDNIAAHAGGADEERMKRILAQYPLRRLGRPDDVVPMVLLLASPLSSWTTGQVVSVNGGYAMV